MGARPASVAGHAFAFDNLERLTGTTTSYSCGGPFLKRPVSRINAKRHPNSGALPTNALPNPRLPLRANAIFQDARPVRAHRHLKLRRPSRRLRVLVS